MTQDIKSKDFIIKVTQKHIDLGSKKDPYCCAINLCIIEKLKVKSVTGHFYIGVWAEDKSWFRKFHPDKNLLEWLKAFDLGRNVPPITVSLEDEKAKIVSNSLTERV